MRRLPEGHLGTDGDVDLGAEEEQLPWFDAADELPRYTRFRSDAPPIRHGPRK